MSDDDFDDEFMAALDAAEASPPQPKSRSTNGGSGVAATARSPPSSETGGGGGGSGDVNTSSPAATIADGGVAWRQKRMKRKKLPEWMEQAAAAPVAVTSSAAADPLPTFSGRSKGLVQCQMDREFEKDQTLKRRRLEGLKEDSAAASPPGDGKGGAAPLLLGRQPHAQQSAADAQAHVQSSDGSSGGRVLLTQALFPRRIVVFDVESTGFASDDVIIELGAVELLAGVRTGAQFHSYIQHRKDSISFAMQVHGLDQRFLADKPPADYVVPSFMRWVDGAALVGHNVSFDARMLDAELERLSLPPVPSACLLCTKQLFSLLFPNYESGRKLDDLLEFFDVKRNNLRKNAHGALLDADLTAEVLVAMMSCIPPGNGGPEGRASRR